MDLLRYLFQKFYSVLIQGMTALAFFYLLTINAHTSDTTPNNTKPPGKRLVMLGGWYNWDPYQYLAIPGDPKSLTGLDYALQKQIMELAGYKIEVSAVSWKQHNEDLVEGKRDFAMGAFYSERRAQYNYLTEPYRYEENSIFVLRENESPHNYTNIPDFISAIKKNGYVIGIVDGYRYANNEFNKFVEDPENAKHLVKSQTDNDNLHLLVGKKIDAFISDKIVGATIIWREKKGRQISQIDLKDSKAPVYMLLSKKTVTYEEYQHINNVIKDFVRSNDYKKIISWYLYPVLLLETIDSVWFYLIELLGITSFALSGVVLASRINASLLGTFILALLPSFGGGIFRDIIFGRYPIGFLLSTTYIVLVLSVTVIGFFSIKLFNIVKVKIPPERLERFKDPLHKRKKIFDDFLMITDAIGLAAFTVSGVLVCMLAKVSPLWLWGPFLAFLSGAGGGFIRDIIIKDIQKTGYPIEAINGSLYGEIAIFWGGWLSFYLFWTADDVDPGSIERMVLLTIIACFATRLAVYVYRIPNILFFKPDQFKKEGSEI